MIKDNEKALFLNKINELKPLGFELCHFTDFTNFVNILNGNCIHSREYCLNNKIKFNDGAEQEIIKKTNMDVRTSARLYFRAKTPTLYATEGIKKIDNQNGKHIPRPVYFIFNDEIIINEECKFTDGNASSIYTKFGFDFSFFENINWDYVLHDTALIDEDTKSEIIRCRQAEVLFKNSINLKYIKKVIFRSNADYKQALNIFKNSNIHFEVNSKYFSEKNLADDNKRNINYIEDYHISYEKKELIIKLKFKYVLNDSKVKYSLTDSNGRVVSKFHKANCDIKKIGKYGIETNQFKDTRILVIKYSNINYKLLFLNILLDNINCVKERIDQVA